MDICYLCDSALWEFNRDISYYFDHECIENFYRAFNQDIETLEELITVVQLYRQMIASIQHTLQYRHDHMCGTCEHCGQHVDMDLDKPRKPLPYTKWSEAIAYYTGLNEAQSDVLKKLENCITEMSDIAAMVGMEEIKSKFVKLMKFLATVNQSSMQDNSHMMHMVISGPPGHGKTEIAKLLGRAFRKSGLLTSDKFVIATRADLIGAYCGHTAKATTEMFDQAKGGVIFIDEVYALGNPEQRDVFTKECIDTINQLLSERSDTLCIVAGYEQEIQTCFFAYNQGLARRFPWRFKIRKYTPANLVDIFKKKLADLNWTMEDRALRPNDIEEYEYAFANAGGDIANLVTSCMLAYYDNAFLSTVQQHVLTRKDVLKGLDAYMSNKTKDERASNPPPAGMYT